MRRFFRKRNSAQPSRGSGGQRRVNLGFETMERKILLATDVTFGPPIVQGGQIFIPINGDSTLPDRITLTHVAQNEVEVTVQTFADFVSNTGPDGTLVDTQLRTYDFEELEFNAALQGLSFGGLVIDGRGGHDIVDAELLKNYSNGQITLKGGDGDDTIITGFRGDSIEGGAGNDTILNADALDAAEGISGGPNGVDGDWVDFVPRHGAINFTSDDVECVDATNLDDTIDLSGNPQNVTIIGRGGNDMLTSGDGNDIIEGGGGNDTIDSGAGNDSIAGGAGHDSIDAGAGNDFVRGGAGNDEIHGGQDGDELRGGSGDDKIFGEGGPDSLFGGAGNDYLDGGFGADTLNGGDGNDLLVGGPGNNVVNGGAGNDFVSYHGSDAGVVINLTTGSVSGGDASGDSLANVESVIGTAFDDTLIGDAGNNTLVGLGGNDSIDGLAGADHLRGDSVVPATLVGIPCFDTITTAGVDGNDRIDGGDGNDAIWGDGGNDTLNGESGNHVSSKSETGNDTIHGGSGDDVIRGDAGNDVLNGNDGNDTIVGDGYVTDGTVDDSDFLGGVDTIHGNNGSDTIYTNNSLQPGRAGVGDDGDMAFGDDGPDSIFGDDGDDDLVGDNGTTELGNDVIQGFGGNDFLFGGNGSDTLTGGLGVDIMDGGTGGADGDDTIRVDVEILPFGPGAGLLGIVDTAIVTGSGTDHINVAGAPISRQAFITDQLLDSVFGDPLIVSDYNAAIDVLDFI